MNRNYHITGSQLTVAFFCYSIISMLLFLFTAGGFTAALGSMFNLIFYTGCFLLLLVKVALSRRSEHDTVVFPVWILMSIGALQICVYLFNFGDCGDRSGSYLFLQRVFIFIGTPSEKLCRYTETHAWFFLPVLFGHLTYYILIFSLFVVKPIKWVAVHES